MNRSWKNKPHSGRGLPFRGGRGRGWNSKFYGRPPPLLENPMVQNNKYRFLNQHYYEEQLQHQYEYPPNHGNPSWAHRNRNNFEYKHQNHHHFIPPHPPPPLLPLNPPRLVRPPSPLPGSEEFIQREINEKSAYLKRHLALAIPPEQSFLEDTDISNFSDNNLYKTNIISIKGSITENHSESATTQKNEIVRKQHKPPTRQQKPQNNLNVNEIHCKILNHISNMSFGQKVNLVNQVTPTSYDVALQQINRQKRLELSKALRDMCNNQLKADQNSTDIINSIIPDFDIKIEELPKELVEQLSTTLNENVSEVIQDCSVDPELFFQQAADMLNTSLEVVENSSLGKVNSKDINFDRFLEVIPNVDAPETQFQNVNNPIPNEFEENIFHNHSFLPPNLIDFPVQNDDSNNLNCTSMLTKPLVDMLPPSVQNNDLTADEFYGNEINEENLPLSTEEERIPHLYANLPLRTEENQNRPFLSNKFEFDHETESLLNFEETSQYRNPWFNPSPPSGKDEAFLTTVQELPQLSNQESPEMLTDPSWDLPTIEESNVNFEEACQEEDKNQISEANLNFTNEACLDEEQSQNIEPNLNLTNEASQNEEQSQIIMPTVKPVVYYLKDELNQINELRDDILVENNTADVNKTSYEDEAENYRSSDSSNVENTDRPSSENWSPEKDYKRKQDRLNKMQKRNLRSPNYREERRSSKYRNKYSDEKWERRGEERLRGRDLEEGRRHFKDRWSRETCHSKRYYKDELHPHRLEYEDENVYVHNKYKNSHKRSKSNNYYHSYDEYCRKHKDGKDYKKPEKQKGDLVNDHIDKKLISRSTSEESNSKNLQKSLKDRIEMMLKHSTKPAREDSKAEESLILQNCEGEVEQHKVEEEKIELEVTEEENNSSLNKVAQVCSETMKKTIEDPELKNEDKMDFCQDNFTNEDNWKNSKMEDEPQVLQEANVLVEENISPSHTPPILDDVLMQKQVSMEVPTIEIVPSVSAKRSCIQDHVKQTPPKIWRSPGEKKFMMELFPPKLEQNLVVAKASIESTQPCSRPDHVDQAINNGHLVMLTNRTHPLPFSETNTIDIVAELENCINSMTKTTKTEILNSSEVSSTSDTLKLHEKSELKQIAKPFCQNLEIGKKNSEKVNETDKSESGREIKKKKQTTSTQTSIKHKSTSVQVISNIETQSKISNGTQTNPVVAFENNNEIFEAFHIGINKKILKTTHKKKVVQRMLEIDKEIERLTKLRQSLYNCIMSDNDSENDHPIDAHSSPSGSRKRISSVNTKNNRKKSNKTKRDSLNAVVSEKRPRSDLSRNSSASKHLKSGASVENHGTAEIKDVVKSERRSESSLSHKSRASENRDRGTSVESRGRGESKDGVTERRSESSLSHKSRVSENPERCTSVESHGRGRSKDSIIERRSESSLSLKSRVSENPERGASVESHGRSGSKDGVTERRSNSSSSYKSRISENRERGVSMESHGMGESKDVAIGGKAEERSNSSLSHKSRTSEKHKRGYTSNHEISASIVSRDTDTSKDKVDGERIFHESSVVSHKSEKVKKSRSSHKNIALESLETDASTESDRKTPYVVIKDIAQVPEYNLSHNRERCEPMETQKEINQVEGKFESSHKCISPEKRDPADSRTKNQNASIQKIRIVLCSDSDAVQQEPSKAKLEKMETFPTKKNKRSCVRKPRTWKKKGKHSERAKNNKTHRVATLLENPAKVEIHEETSSVSFPENVETATSVANIASTSSVSCASAAANATDAPCGITLKLNSSVKSAVITESNAEVVSQKLSGIVPKVTRKRLKIKKARGRKSNNRYSETIEEVATDQIDVSLLDNREPISEILPFTSSVSDVSCALNVKSISNVKIAVITESDAELVSPKLSEIVPQVIPNRIKMRGPKRRRLKNPYSQTIDEVATETFDVPVLDNPEPKSEITSSVLCTATVNSPLDVSTVSPASNVETEVPTNSDAELVSPTLLETVPPVTVNRFKMKGPRGRKSKKQYSKIIDEVTNEIIDILALDNPEPTSKIPPITSSVSCSVSVASASDVSNVSCDATVESISSGSPAANLKTVITESDSESILLKLPQVFPEVGKNRFIMKGPRGRKLNNQNSKTIKEESKEKIVPDAPVLDNSEPISEILPISNDASFIDNETKKRPGKRKRGESSTGPERKKKFKAGKRRNSNKMTSVEVVGKINMFPVVSIPRCEELEIKLKDLPNGIDSEEDVETTSPVEILGVKEEDGDEGIDIKVENSAELIATESITPSPVVDENYEINFSGFTGAILVIKVIASTAIAASDKGRLFWFNLFTGELLSTHHLSNLPITSIIVVKRNDENFMYVGSLDTSITIMNFEANAIVKKDNVVEPIQCMELAWNSIFIGSDRGSLITYDLKTEKIKEEIKISESNVLMIKATQEGPRKVLVIATRNALVSIRDAQTGLLLRTMETPFLPTVYTLLFDKNLIYCGTSQHDILVYTFEDGQLIFKHEATKSKGVVCMQIVGNLLFAGCYNGNIYVYNTKSNVYLGTMSGPGGLMLSMEIVQDKIIVGTKSSNFKAWRIPQKYLDQN